MACRRGPRQCVPQGAVHVRPGLGNPHTCGVGWGVGVGVRWETCKFEALTLTQTDRAFLAKSHSAVV
jgi:hypothetical protein